MEYIRDLARDLSKEIQRREKELEALRDAYEALSGTTSLISRVAIKSKPAEAEKKPRRKRQSGEQIRTAVEAYLREHAIGKGVFPRQVQQATGYTALQVKHVADNLKKEGKLRGRGAARNAQWYWVGDADKQAEEMNLHVVTDGATKRQRKKHEKGEIEVAYTTEEPAPSENGVAAQN